MSRQRGHADPRRVLSGLQAQLARVSKFQDTIDPAAAIATYGRVFRMLDSHLEEFRRDAGLPERAPWLAGIRTRAVEHRYAHLPAPTDRVYTYWDKPLNTAPPLVQACIAQLRRVHPTLQVLDGASTRELIDIPERIATLLEHDRPAHFSDYLRTRVLEEHGGIWVDATAWVHRNLGDDLQRTYLRAGTIFPRWTGRAIANWFIASQPHTPILALQRRALDVWWEQNDDLPDYFLYHRIFEVIQAIVPEARAQWRAAPVLSSAQAHLLQLEMMQPWRPEPLRRTLDLAPLQKLSYKFDSVPEGSVLEHLLAGDGAQLSAGS
ncbi:capsular polysaccharide synthesis protein [Microbacterium istanbulense]|uniref:Capsular polysaccharide synthesis protein n=1 Tax=Microbacterium istanbulense TaxID=3122049 RepID=A0ABU8LPA0_9MICO